MQLVRGEVACQHCPHLCNAGEAIRDPRTEGGRLRTEGVRLQVFRRAACGTRDRAGQGASHGMRSRRKRGKGGGRSRGAHESSQLVLASSRAACLRRGGRRLSRPAHVRSGSCSPHPASAATQRRQPSRTVHGSAARAARTTCHVHVVASIGRHDHLPGRGWNGCRGGTPTALVRARTARLQWRRRELLPRRRPHAAVPIY